MTALATERSEKRTPATLVILSTILLVAALSSLVIPRGEYERVEKHFPKLIAHTVQPGEDLALLLDAVGAPSDLTLAAVLDAETRTPVESLEVGARVLVAAPGMRRTVVVPGTYTRLEKDSRSLAARSLDAAGGMTLAPIRGFVVRAEVIAFVLLIGGAFGVILATGAIDRSIGRAVTVVGEGPLRILVIPVSMTLFSLGGAIFGMGESTIAFVLVTVPLSLRLGYDTITGICMCYLASQIGFAGAFFNPFTVGIAQSIAELPQLSGLGFRLVTWVLVTGVGIAFVSLWARRVRANPQLSPTWALDERLRTRVPDDQGGGGQRLGLGELGVVAATVGTLVLTGVGVALWGWYIEEMSAVFMGAAVVAGIAGRLRAGRIAQEFARGAAIMIEPALVIALSAGLLSVLQEARILDTILTGLAAPLELFPAPIASVLVMCGQAVINFFVPSGSGQAAMTMPIMTPLCDILGVNRQVGVLAFQFGDGFGNMLIPTSAVLMGVLGVARVPWTVWIRWVWPLILLLHVIGAALLVAAMYGPSGWMQWPVS